MSLRAIVYGATGMVGEGVLHETLLHEQTESVLVIGRRPCGVAHAKLREILLADFLDYAQVRDRLRGYNACFFCLGVSSVGMRESDYRKITYELTLRAAQELVLLNPEMTFCYVSGAGTDSTEKGSLMWARVKGKTENDLLTLPFRGVYNFRPGFIRPIRGLNRAYRASRILSPLYPLMQALLPGYVCTLEDLGHAMIQAALRGYEKHLLENRDIAILARRRHDS